LVTEDSDDAPKRIVVNMKFDSAVLERVDDAARRPRVCQGIGGLKGTMKIEIDESALLADATGEG
jgi:hypothetical protein